MDSGDVHTLVRSIAIERFEAVAGLYVPQLDGPVVTAAGKQIPSGAKGHPSDTAGMTSQDCKTATSFTIPEADRLVFTATGKHVAAWVESNGPDPTAMADRKSTRLNSSHTVISYAVFCLKKKKRT